MFDTLEKLRQKPAHTRRTIAFVSTLVVSLIIGFFWFKSVITTINQGSVIGADSETVAPFKALSNNISDIFSNFRQGLDGLKGELSTLSDIVASTTATTTPEAPVEVENRLENGPENANIDTYEREGTSATTTP